MNEKNQKRRRKNKKQGRGEQAGQGNNDPFIIQYDSRVKVAMRQSQKRLIQKYVQINIDEELKEGKRKKVLENQSKLNCNKSFSDQSKIKRQINSRFDQNLSQETASIDLWRKLMRCQIDQICKSHQLMDEEPDIVNVQIAQNHKIQIKNTNKSYKRCETHDQQTQTQTPNQGNNAFQNKQQDYYLFFS